VIELLVAAASSCAGALFGFLFGIPRGSMQSNTEERVAKPNNYRPSNSLEQVTEWLTKILVGAGLIELAKISGALNAAGIAVAGAFNSAPSGTAIVTKAVIVSFVVYGFLVAFLWTRIYYSRLQALGDKDIWDALNDARQQAIHEKESKEEALSILEGVAAGAIPTRQAGPRRAQVSAKSSTSPQETDEWPDEVRAKVEEFKNAPNDWNDDTAGRIFRGASQEAHGKILEGEIVKELRSALVVNLRVRTKTGERLEGPVSLLLHPSFTKSVMEVQPEGDRAEARITAGGWFTVVAIIDKGNTVLSYNLKQLPNAPEWFKQGG